MFFSFQHHPAELFVHLDHLVANLAPLPQLLPSRTLALQLLVGLVPYAKALVAKLALANACHMRAPHFLLDGLSALGAIPCVVLDPARVDFC